MISFLQKFIFFKKFILDLFFPSRCFFCEKSTENQKFSLICQSCFVKIPQNNALFCPKCFRRRPQLTNCPKCAPKLNLKILGIASDYNDDKIKMLIWKFKYNFLKELSYPLAELLINYLKKAAPKWCTDSNFIIIPVPLHKKREKWRGFNQATVLGEIIAKNFGWHLENLALIKIKNNLSQIEIKNFEQRQNNVKNSFFVQKPELIKNKKIILIDDVFTSGATMFECARVLKEAGAKIIYGLVIAKG